MSETTGTRAQRAILTRAAILDSARREFARNGYAHATVRAIAAGAQIDPSMVIRYFGDKRALFDAAVDGRLELPDITGLPARRRGRALVEYFAELWGGPVAEDRFRMLLFSASTDHEAADRIRGVVSEQLLPMVRTIAGPDGAETRAALIASSVIGVSLLRLVLAAPEMVAVPDAELIPLLAATIDRYLTAPIPPAGSRAQG